LTTKLVPPVRRLRQWLGHVRGVFHPRPHAFYVVELDVGDVEVVVRLLVVHLANGEVLVAEVEWLPLVGA
jgi:hypothetical protein